MNKICILNVLSESFLQGIETIYRTVDFHLREENERQSEKKKKKPTELQDFDPLLSSFMTMNLDLKR